MTQNGTVTTKVGAPAASADVERYFAYVISSIANKISRGGSRVYLRLFGIGIIEWRILTVLAEHPRCTANLICSIIELDKAAASRSVQVLERHGYIQTAVDPADARKRTLSLTASGSALYRRAIKVAMQRERRLLAGFTDQERAVLLGFLQRMQANAIEMDQFDFGLPEVEVGALPSDRPGRKTQVHAA
jgi:DNA-binding MarR family transcriptional regulator